MTVKLINHLNMWLKGEENNVDFFWPVVLWSMSVTVELVNQFSFGIYWLIPKTCGQRKLKKLIV